MSDHFGTLHDMYDGMLSQAKELCVKLCIMLIQLCLFTTTKIYEKIIHVSPPLKAFPSFKNRFIDNLDKEWAQMNTHFSKDELRKIYIHFRIPEKITFLCNCNILHGETVLLLSLVYMVHAIP